MEVNIGGEMIPLWQLGVALALISPWLIAGCWHLLRVIDGVRRTGGWVSVAEVIPADLVGAALLGNLFLGVSLIGIFGAMQPEQAGPKVPVPGMLVVSALMTLGLYLFIVGLLGFTLKKRGSSLKSFLGFDKRPLLLRAAKGLLILVAVFPLLQLVNLSWSLLLTEGFGVQLREQDPVMLFRQTTNMFDLAAIILLAVVIAPLGEELVFRGYLLPVAKKYLGRWPAIIGTGLFFGMIHGNWAAAAALAVLGIVLALAYEHTGSLVTPIIMHMTFNSITVLALLLTATLPKAVAPPTAPVPLPEPVTAPAGMLTWPVPLSR